MAGNLAEEQKYKVGWAYLHNDGNFAFQNSYVCENLGGEHKALTKATNGAEIRMNRAFAGGGVSNFKPHKAFKAHEVYSYTQTSAKEVQSTRLRHPATVSTRYTIFVALRDLKQKFDTS